MWNILCYTWNNLLLITISITISITIGGVTMFGREYYFKSDYTNDKVITDETNLIKED